MPVVARDRIAMVVAVYFILDMLCFRAKGQEILVNRGDHRRFRLSILTRSSIGGQRVSRKERLIQQVVKRNREMLYTFGSSGVVMSWSQAFRVSRLQLTIGSGQSSKAFVVFVSKAARDHFSARGGSIPHRSDQRSRTCEDQSGSSKAKQSSAEILED